MGVNVNTGMPAGYQNPLEKMIMNMYGNMMPTQTPQQPTSPPMIHAALIETPSEEWARNYNVSPGQTQIFYMRDESAMFVKSVNADGSMEFDVYPKQAPKPAPEYLTREQVEEMIRSAKEEQ